MTYHDWPIRDLSLVRLPVVDGDVQSEMLAARGNEHRSALDPCWGHCHIAQPQQCNSSVFPEFLGFHVSFQEGSDPSHCQETIQAPWEAGTL